MDCRGCQENMEGTTRWIESRADAVERRLVFEAAAVHLGTTPAVVEKDFWVCYALEHLSHC